ncbi:2-O-methyltransferase NoeI [Methylococcales bacterium]|nr:2-O-methyltransferase NoeI [Methylococcales bacterium]
MFKMKYRFLKYLCELNRLNQNFPARWRLCRWLDQQKTVLRASPAGPAKIANRTYIYLNPLESFDGLKTLIYGLNIREPLTNIISQLLRPGDNMIDVGANVGYFSALASLTVGLNGKIFSFEASPSTYQRLQVLANNNLYRNIKTYNHAVSDANSEIEFHCGPTNHTGISSIRSLGNKTSSVVKVSAIRLDNMIDDFPPIRLIKIDVEGAETLVLNGMKSLLARDKPYVIAEISDSFLRQLGSNKHELIKMAMNKLQVEEKPVYVRRIA